MGSILGQVLYLTSTQVVENLLEVGPDSIDNESVLGCSFTGRWGPVTENIDDEYLPRSKWRRAWPTSEEMFDRRQLISLLLSKVIIAMVSSQLQHDQDP